MPPADGAALGPDSGREAVHAAEIAAFDGTDLEVVIGVEAARRTAASVTGGPWWSGPVVDVRPARVDAASSSTRCTTRRDGATAAIRVAAAQATVATVAHELAHALAGVDAGHGPRFRRALLDVVLVATNLDSRDRRGALHHDQLDAAFAAFGLSVGERGWPPPPTDVVGPIPL